MAEISYQTYQIEYVHFIVIGKEPLAAFLMNLQYECKLSMSFSIVFIQNIFYFTICSNWIAGTTEWYTFRHLFLSENQQSEENI